MWVGSEGRELESLIGDNIICPPDGGPSHLPHMCELRGHTDQSRGVWRPASPSLERLQVAPCSLLLAPGSLLLAEVTSPAVNSPFVRGQAAHTSLIVRLPIDRLGLLTHGYMSRFVLVALATLELAGNGNWVCISVYHAFQFHHHEVISD